MDEMYCQKQQLCRKITVSNFESNCDWISINHGTDSKKRMNIKYISWIFKVSFSFLLEKMLSRKICVKERSNLQIVLDWFRLLTNRKKMYCNTFCNTCLNKYWNFSCNTGLKKVYAKICNTIFKKSIAIHAIRNTRGCVISTEIRCCAMVIKIHFTLEHLYFLYEYFFKF